MTSVWFTLLYFWLTFTLSDPRSLDYHFFNNLGP